MKKLYWRPHRISLRVLTLVTAVALGGTWAVEAFPVAERQPYYAEKMRSAQLANRAFGVLREARLKRGLPIDAEADPTGSGLIGVLLSPVTTNPGHLPSKQTTINPNWAAAVVHLLKRAGAEPGDLVGVGMSGSFPAINVSVLAAIETLELEPIVVTSAGASQWGGNQELFMWPDMERVLYEAGILETRSDACSRGGIDDRALGLSKEGKRLLDNAIDRNGIPRLDVRNFDESVQRRYELIMEKAGGRNIAAYINIGGGAASVGSRAGKHLFKPGLTFSTPPGTPTVNSVMTRLISEGTPIIHLVRIDELAERYGFPLQPATMPTPGNGRIFRKDVRNVWLVAGVLTLIFVLLVAFIRLDWGYRLLDSGPRRGHEQGPPEQMV